MAKLEVKKFGEEILRKQCSAVTKFDKDLEKLANDMLETMYESNGVGLAAPQVGVNKRVIVVDTDWASERYENEQEEDPDYNPFIMVNPVIVYKEGEVDSLEGCLSFPEVYTVVKRAHRIVFKFQDLKGKEQRMEAEGDLFCRCIQHEIDHLDGQLFVDIATDKTSAKKELDEHGFKDVKSAPNPLLA
jgi:peptide deformylase